MKISKKLVAAATAAALTAGTLAPVASAQEPAPQGGSAMSLYTTVMNGALNAIAGLRGDRHPTETFMMDILLVGPLVILLFPLQMIGEAEINLSSKLG
ncbi:hypothetical protein [Corynebacterium sp. p3-SID1194]|uniref:hypothetical protein n=1 Tax=Corynebacterium sp. p3-SID1194 TaxID=2916105 RepID=UPI0021A6CFCC|nr:hypothetical protein [Corynebacterium sp. p3-SID1194]MCT1449801.1 hypothetical protein [Corynebacterium sp. p3-SID1194]